MDAGVHLLLFHEFPSIHQAAERYACSFDDLFPVTPPLLLAMEIYTEVALPLAHGELRKASMVMVLKAIVDGLEGRASTSLTTLQTSSFEGSISRWRRSSLLRIHNRVRGPVTRGQSRSKGLHAGSPARRLPSLNSIRTVDKEESEGFLADPTVISQTDVAQSNLHAGALS